MDYHEMSPKEVRELIRKGEITSPTAGMCGGYAQGNLVILPKRYADDFREYARLNPKPCPILEITEGTPLTTKMAEGGNLVTDIPKYNIYRHGKLAETVTDASPYWEDGFVGFLIGCSFSFEEALIKAGIEVRHIATNRNVPMYKTNIPCKTAGVFSGPVVVSMRPMKPELVEKAYEVTGRFPNVHGAPIHSGNPAEIGIADINRPDYGDAVEVYPGEVPVFWACGVTPQAAIEQAKPEIVITHAPGHMFITDVLNENVEEALAK